MNIFPPKKSLKNLVINVLLVSNNNGLSVIDIRKEIKNKEGVSITYQGINKILTTFREENIVTKENNNWKINKEWIDNTISVLNSYKNQEKTPVYNKELRKISFPTMSKALDFIITNIENDKLRNGGERIFITHVKNIGFFRVEKNQMNFLRTIAKNTEVHVLMEGKNLINRLVGKYFKTFGFNVYMGVPRTTNYTSTVYGNTIYHTYSGTELTDYLTKKYSQIKNITNKEAIELFSSLKDDKRFSIKFTFETDREIVESTKNFLLELTKGKKI